MGYNGAEHKTETNSPNETLKGQESQLAGDQPTDYLQALPRTWTSGLQDTTPGSEWGHSLNKGLPECKSSQLTTQHIASLPTRYNKLVLYRNVKAIHVGKSVCF